MTKTKQEKIQEKKNPNHLDVRWGFIHSTTCASHHRIGRGNETKYFSHHLVYNGTETLMSQDAVTATSNFRIEWLALILGPGVIKH